MPKCLTERWRRSRDSRFEKEDYDYGDESDDGMARGIVGIAQSGLFPFFSHVKAPKLNLISQQSSPYHF